jgi:hypothetical protein
MDVDLAPGIDFVERITTAVDGCRALLVVMGPRWASGAGGNGPRIAEPDDFVRLEVETALRSADTTVIPVLVAGARMPTPGELPEPLRPLARRNAIELSDQRWRYDVGRLLDTVAGVVSPPRVVRAAAAPRTLGPLQVLEGALLGGVLAGLLVPLFRDLNAKDGTLSEKVVTTTERNALVWGIVGLLLAAWLAWRRGERRGIPGVALAGLLLGALGAALGSRVFAAVKFVEPPPGDSMVKLVSVGSLALVGAGIGLALGAAWRPRRLGAALLAGAGAGALVQVLLVAAGAHGLPSDALRHGAGWAAAAQGAAITAGALALLLLGDPASRQRSPARQ